MDLAGNVVRLIMLEAAATHQVDPLRLSFAHALRAILSFASALAEAPPWKLPAIYQTMLAEIATQLVPLSPGRHEPKNYPSFRCTRQQCKLQNVVKEELFVTVPLIRNKETYLAKYQMVTKTT